MISKVIPEEQIAATTRAIKKADNIVILAHKSPDGDAVGSSLALWHFLESRGKIASIVMPDQYNLNLGFLPGCQDIVVYEGNESKAIDLVNAADLIFCLDFNNLRRIGRLGPHVGASKATKVMIDHHPDHDNFAEIQISHPEICATSELIFRLICRMGCFPDMSQECAECIMAGILTDTGGLAYNSNSPEVYTIINHLINKGVDKDSLYRKLFYSSAESRMRLMGYFLSEKMRIYSQYHIAITALTKAELERFDYHDGDTEGLVNLPLSIMDVNASVFLKETDDRIKISFRSQGDLPVNTIATDLFGGGGHMNAAGAESHDSLEDTIKKIEEALPRYFK